MGADYRDDLTAAHARIAELEETVRALEAEALERPDPSAAVRFPELEAAVERARVPADAQRSARRLATLQLTSTAIPIAGLIFSLLHLPLLATCMSLIFIAAVVAGFVMRARLKPAQLRLAETEQRLADARRVYLLEQKLAAATEVRIRVEGETVADGVPSEAEEIGPRSDGVEPMAARRS